MSETIARPKMPQVRKAKGIPIMDPEKRDRIAAQVHEGFRVAGHLVTRAAVEKTVHEGAPTLREHEVEQVTSAVMRLHELGGRLQPVAPEKARGRTTAGGDGAPAPRARPAPPAAPAAGRRAARYGGAPPARKATRPAAAGQSRTAITLDALRVVLPTMPQALARELFAELERRGVQPVGHDRFAALVTRVRKELGLPFDQRRPKPRGPRARAEANGSGPGDHPGGSESRAHLEAESSPAINGTKPEAAGFSEPQGGHAGSGRFSGGAPVPPAAEDSNESSPRPWKGACIRCGTALAPDGACRVCPILPRPHEPIDSPEAAQDHGPDSGSDVPAGGAARPPLAMFHAEQQPDGTWSIRGLGPLGWLYDMVWQVHLAPPKVARS